MEVDANFCLTGYALKPGRCIWFIFIGFQLQFLNLLYKLYNFVCCVPDLQAKKKHVHGVPKIKSSEFVLTGI
jgi:hypothetical protein